MKEKKEFSLIQRNTPCESSRLRAVQQAAYCINLPQLANHCTCEEKNHLTVSSTGQDSQRNIFACEDKGGEITRQKKRERRS